MFRTIPAGYTSFEHVVLPEIDPGPDVVYAWAHEFKLVGGEGGYLGLETSDGAGSGKAAVLSVWDAIGAEGGAAGRIGDRYGWTCRVSYRWEAGRDYAMRVWTDEPGWWAAAVGEPSSGREVLIGRVQVPPDWRRLASWSVMWTEYGGPALARCADLATSRVTFSVPTADGGTTTPERHESLLGPGTCEGSRVSDLEGGVRHEMGGPSPRG